MIIVDRALDKREREGRPIRVGIFGAGFMAKGFVNQVAHSVPGMEIVAMVGSSMADAKCPNASPACAGWSNRGNWSREPKPKSSKNCLVVANKAGRPGASR